MSPQVGDYTRWVKKSQIPFTYQPDNFLSFGTQQILSTCSRKSVGSCSPFWQLALVYTPACIFSLIVSSACWLPKPCSCRILYCLECHWRNCVQYWFCVPGYTLVFNYSYSLPCDTTTWYPKAWDSHDLQLFPLFCCRHPASMAACPHLSPGRLLYCLPHCSMALLDT